MSYNYDEKIIRDAVEKSECLSDVLRIMGISLRGSNYTTVKKLITKYGIDISHFNPKLVRIRKLNDYYKENIKRDIFYYLRDNIQVSSSSFKERLYKEGLKNRECEMCGQTEIWNGRKMSLVIDHIDGNSLNNKLENLMILCPNCNATLDTHCGKNKIRRNIHLCECGKEIKNSSSLCIKCNAQNRSKFKKVQGEGSELKSLIVKGISYDISEFKKDLFDKPAYLLREKYFVSDSYLSRVCKNFNIEKPNRGYWTKLN
jgi:hypothetical protein